MAKRIRNSSRTQLFFEHIVELCIEAGLVWGEELYIDATEVKANASARSVLDRTNAVLELCPSAIFPQARCGEQSAVLCG